MAAPKQAELTKKLAVVSSSEEEDASYDKSSQESYEDSKSRTDVEKQSTPTVTPKPIAEAESESESDPNSDLDSDSNSDVPAKSTTVSVLPESVDLKRTLAGVSSPEPEKKKAKTEATKSTEIAESTPLGKTLPETFKTPSVTVAETSAGVNKEKPAKKTTTGVVAKEEEVKKSGLIKRIFSKDDDLALLQGIIDFTKKHGDPFEDSKKEALCEFLKKIIKADANHVQILNKVKRLKKNYKNSVKKALQKGKTENDVTFAKDFDRNVFNLSRQIWGKIGSVLTHTSKENCESKTDMKTSGSNSPISGEEMACFIKKEFSGSFGVNVADFVDVWDTRIDQTTKVVMEKQMKELKAKEVKLCLERIGFFANSAKIILNEFDK